MTSDSLTIAAGPLRDLMSSVVLLDYSHPSFTVSMHAEQWTVDVDAGESVDDIIRLEGSELSELLTRSVHEVKARSRQLFTTAPPDARDDLLPFLDLLADMRSRVSSFPLDFSYVPRSVVSPDRPWEVTVELDDQTVVSAGATAFEALSRVVDK